MDRQIWDTQNDIAEIPYGKLIKLAIVVSSGSLGIGLFFGFLAGRAL